jgi:hypothetical protein
MRIQIRNFPKAFAHPIIKKASGDWDDLKRRGLTYGLTLE